jgi:hypothetical protein
MYVETLLFLRFDRRWIQEIDRYACESVAKLIVLTKCDLDHLVDLPTVEVCAGFEFELIRLLGIRRGNGYQSNAHFSEEC